MQGKAKLWGGGVCEDEQMDESMDKFSGDLVRQRAARGSLSEKTCPPDGSREGEEDESRLMWTQGGTPPRWQAMIDTR